MASTGHCQFDSRCINPSQLSGASHRSSEDRRCEKHYWMRDAIQVVIYSSNLLCYDIINPYIIQDDDNLGLGFSFGFTLVFTLLQQSQNKWRRGWDQSCV